MKRDLLPHQCAWCCEEFKLPTDSGTSYGICKRHRREMLGSSVKSSGVFFYAVAGLTVTVLVFGWLCFGRCAATFASWLGW
jgi:hypothetical protein